MAPLSQSYSFSSQGGFLSSSQYVQNSVSNPVDGLRRVTIRQLLNATQTNDAMAPFKIDGFGIRKIMLVANVYRNDPDPFSGRITYGLDDGTGRINGQRWPLKEGDPPFEPFAYARVLGELEQYKSAKNLKVHHIRPVYDGHEVYHHILHTIMDTLTYERGPPPPLMLEDTSLRLDVTADELYSVTQAVERVSISQKAEQSINEHQSTPSPRMPTAEPPVASSSRLPTSSNSSSATSRRYSGLTPLQQDVLSCLSDKETDEDIGVNIEEFVPDVISLNPGLTSKELWSAMEHLIKHEFLITTINEEHYKCI